MESQNNKLTKEEKLIFLLNKIEENSDDYSQKEELNIIKRKIMKKMESESKPTNVSNQI